MLSGHVPVRFDDLSRRRVLVYSTMQESASDDKVDDKHQTPAGTPQRDKLIKIRVFVCGAQVAT